MVVGKDIYSYFFSWEGHLCNQVAKVNLYLCGRIL